ncbi:MAG TPA: DUF192 domain-containing protein [Polyangiaceae bacterium]|nr:DUF192 domain-containing protein [Polyangiaceae bacterium]
MRALWLLLSLSAATCQRVDEPSPAPSPPSAPALKKTSSTAFEAPPAPLTIATSAPSTASAASSAHERHADADALPDAGRCIQPLVEPPPPQEEPASICPHEPDDKVPTLKHGKIRVPEAKGAPSLDIEIADTPATEERGLMYRTKLGAEQGMIFVWPYESLRTFWMHNTCLPLDMLFVAKDGTIVGLLEQVPALNDRPRQVRCPAAYVLEVNAGWSRRHGVKPGMKLDIKL